MAEEESLILGSQDKCLTKGNYWNKIKDVECRQCTQYKKNTKIEEKWPPNFRLSSLFKNKIYSQILLGR